MDPREDIVRRVVESHPEFHTNPNRDDAKAALLPFVIQALNAAENTANWGYLCKTDQGNKIPNDIVCWKPTREIVDVLSDDGAIWDMKGVAPYPAWVWQPVAAVTPPIDIPQPPTQEQDIEAIVNAVVERVTANILPELEEMSGYINSIYQQNERIFANLTAQNTELRNLLTGGSLGAASRQDTGNTVHLSPETIDRLAGVGVGIFRAIAAARK